MFCLHICSDRKHRRVLLYEGPRHDRWEVPASCDDAVLTYFSQVILFNKLSVGQTDIGVRCCQRYSGWPLLYPHSLFPLQWNSNFGVKSSYYFDCDFGKSKGNSWIIPQISMMAQKDTGDCSMSIHHEMAIWFPQRRQGPLFSRNF